MIKISLNNVNHCIGSENLGFKISQEQKNSRRSIYVSQDIKKNNKLTIENIKSIRPGFGLHPKFFYKILGKSVKKKIKYGSPLKLKDIQK
jgi:sialic acid synthase SpsE